MLSTQYDWIKYHDDVYDARVQQIIYDMLAKIDGGEAVSEEYNSREDVISLILQVDQKRREIQYGQYRRLKLEPASRFEWKDPRRADGVPILARDDANDVKVNHKSHTAFARSIVTNKKAYFVGEAPDITAGDKFFEWAEKNSFTPILSEIVDDAAGQGEGFTLLYSPGDKQAYITKEQAYNCVVIYNPDNNYPAYGLIYVYDSMFLNMATSNVRVYFYDMRTVTEYAGSISEIKRVSDPVPHLFTGVPLIEWRNNSERISDIEPVLGLMDLYDVMDSDLLSELSQLRLAYLFIKGLGLADAQANDSTDLASLTEKLKKAGWFASDNPDGDIKFISKEVNYEAVKYAKENLKERIFQMANSYDPVTVQGSGGDVTAFQIRMKLFPLEQSTAETEVWFRQAFMYMYRLLAAFYADFGDGLGDEEVSIEFKRNIPSNIMQDIIDARNGGFFMSQKQIAKRLPFAIDQEENEMELAEEADNVLMTPGIDDSQRLGE